MVIRRGGYHPPAVTSLASPMGKLSNVCETDEVTAKNETTGTSSVTFGDSVSPAGAMHPVKGHGIHCFLPVQTVYCCQNRPARV